FSSTFRHGVDYHRDLLSFPTRRSSDLKGLLEGTLQAGTSAVSDKLLDLVGLGGKSAADKGKDTRDYPFLYQRQTCHQVQPNQAKIGRAVQQECRDRSRMPSSA